MFIVFTFEACKCFLWIQKIKLNWKYETGLGHTWGLWSQERKADRVSTPQPCLYWRRQPPQLSSVISPRLLSTPFHFFHILNKNVKYTVQGRQFWRDSGHFGTSEAWMPLSAEGIRVCGTEPCRWQGVADGKGAPLPSGIPAAMRTSGHTRTVSMFCSASCLTYPKGSYQNNTDWEL